MAVQSEIERATTLLRQGKTLEAAAVSGAILAREPNHAVAAHLLGLALKPRLPSPLRQQNVRGPHGLTMTIVALRSYQVLI